MTINISDKTIHYSTFGAAILLFAFATATGVPALSQAPDRAGSMQEAKASNSRDAHTYHVIYSIAESESGKRIGVQKYQLSVVSNGTRATLKQGSKNPVMTGGYIHEGAPDTTQFQFTYLDVGLNLSAVLTEENDGLRLTAKVEQLSMVDGVNPQTLKDPTIKQNALESSSLVKPGVPVVLGSYDVPGSTRHFEIEVTVEKTS